MRAKKSKSVVFIGDVTPQEKIRPRMKAALPDHSICRQCANSLQNACYHETRVVETINKRMGIVECTGYVENRIHRLERRIELITQALTFEDITARPVHEDLNTGRSKRFITDKLKQGK